MRKLPVPIVASLLLVFLGTGVPPKHGNFNGEIMDSNCGEMGSHAMLNPLETARQCTIDCVRAGARYVLYDPGIRMAYGLDNQRMAAGFPGERVRVIGTLDKVTHVIHVIDIRPAIDSALFRNAKPLDRGASGIRTMQKKS